jgi:predicted DNA-binding protein (MmcQ/YjbR family)
MRQAYYQNSLEAFIQTKDEEIIGKLNLAGTAFASQWTITTVSWDSSIGILKKSFRELIQKNPLSNNWHVLLEYEIPRLAGRIDAVILADDIIFVIEFKFERKKYELADIRQAEDYALDLSDFHLKSREKIIIPILLAPLAKHISQDANLANKSNVLPCVKANADNLSMIIYDAYLNYHNDLDEGINPVEWEQSEYQPTPTIVQAANALFAGQKVEDISKYGADNLSKTCKSLIDIINQAIERNKKAICFVTGVPGSGKTLVGLNVIHKKNVFGNEDFNSAYFSGNGPLIKVLRESLSRDDYQRQENLFKSKQINIRPKRSDSKSKIKSKIQNLHQIIKDGLSKKKYLTEKVVVFDEAQRCWDAKQFSNKAKQNRNREKNPFLIEEKSEAEMLFEFMNRHDGWSVIIALVGGGQEINTGEGGIGEWGKAIQNKYSNWEIHISPQLLSGDSSTANQKLFIEIPNDVIIYPNENLHLSVSQRSFKASRLNEWVNAVINNDSIEAAQLSDLIRQAYPLFITRDVNAAKDWLRKRKAGTKRIGLVASSGGLRLKPYGIHVREEIDEALWFLNDETDIRSSYFLEIAATEYKVQGLELDWVGICWDADLRRNKKEWDFKNFSGTIWQQTNTIAEQQFLLNTYRVLLTRAREGMIIFVPPGDEKDATRLPEFYNPIFEYLRSCGLQEI